MTNEEWVPVTARYGIADLASVARWCAQGDEDLDTARWRARHNASATVPATRDDDPPPLFRCTCPGDLRISGGRCAERATQEDRLCDACREHCWCEWDRPGEPVRRLSMVDVWGMAGPLS